MGMSLVRRALTTGLPGGSAAVVGRRAVDGSNGDRGEVIIGRTRCAADGMIDVDKWPVVACPSSSSLPPFRAVA
jgi:hypothetical protein